jgi:hypothetical protein
MSGLPAAERDADMLLEETDVPDARPGRAAVAAAADGSPLPSLHRRRAGGGSGGGSPEPGACGGVGPAPALAPIRVSSGGGRGSGGGGAAAAAAGARRSSGGRAAAGARGSSGGGGGGGGMTQPQQRRQQLRSHAEEEEQRLLLVREWISCTRQPAQQHREECDRALRAPAAGQQQHYHHHLPQPVGRHVSGHAHAGGRAGASYGHAAAQQGGFFGAAGGAYPAGGFSSPYLQQRPALPGRPGSPRCAAGARAAAAAARRAVGAAGASAALPPPGAGAGGSYAGGGGGGGGGYAAAAAASAAYYSAGAGGYAYARPGSPGRGAPHAASPPCGRRTPSSGSHTPGDGGEAHDQARPWARPSPRGAPANGGGGGSAPPSSGGCGSRGRTAAAAVPPAPPPPPARWSPEEVRKWVTEVGGGRFKAATAALPPHVDGKALSRFPEVRFKQLFGQDDAAARRGRALYELFRDEVRAHSAQRMAAAREIAAEAAEAAAAAGGGW